MNTPLMPKATATWLIENTALTFEQISEFCALHILEVQSLADEVYGIKIKGCNPIISSQLTAEEIQRCEADPKARLKISKLPPQLVKKAKKTSGKKYTPIAKRQDKPDAIFYLIKKFPELQDAQICKLIGTTKTTVQAIRTKNHWKITSMRDIDPVISGFCSQSELDSTVAKARARMEKKEIVETYSHDNKPLLKEETLFAESEDNI